MWAAAENNAAVARGADRGRRRHQGALEGRRVHAVPVRRARRSHRRGAGRCSTPAPTSTRRCPTAPARCVLAVMNAHYELAALLLDEGADPNADAPGLDGAASDRLDAPAELPASTCPARCRPASLDSLELVRKLVQHGADVNARQTEGAEGRQPEHAEPDRRDAVPARGQVGRPAADARCCSSSAPIRRSTNDDGTTPLMVAAGVGIWAPGENPGTDEEALAAVKLLLEVGGGQRERRRQERRDGAARRDLPRRLDPDREVPGRQGRQARRPEQQGMDAADRLPTASSTPPTSSSAIPRRRRCSGR